MQSPRAVAVLRKFTDVGLRSSEDGQDLLEYGLLAALIALVALGAVASVGRVVMSVFWRAIAAAF